MPRGSSGSLRESRLAGEEGAERGRFEQVPPATLRELELREDRCRVGVALCVAELELRHEPRPQLLVALVGVEDALDDELRRHRPVPGVLLRAEGDVVAQLAAEAVE